MGAPEVFNLRWDDYEANTRVALMELREEVEFSDVTLVSGDGKQAKASKVILAGGSSFFHKILRENPHQHPLIYLKEVRYKQLLSMLDFLYTGQASIAQEDLNQFLDIAEDLTIKGLTPSDKQTKSLPKTDAPLQTQVSTEENVSAKSKTYPSSVILAAQGQVADEEQAPAKSKTYPPSRIPAPPQGHVAAEEEVAAKSKPFSHSIIPALHQSQVYINERTSSSRESHLRGMTPTDGSNSFPKSNCENDTCIVKVEVGNAEDYNVSYGMDDQGEQYITSVSKRDLRIHEKNACYLRKRVENQNEDKNEIGISAGKKAKEELIKTNSDTFHTKEVDNVIGNESWYEQSEANDTMIPARKQANHIELDKKCGDMDEMVDSKCDIIVTQVANNDYINEQLTQVANNDYINEQLTHDWYEQVNDIKDNSTTQEMERDLNDEAFSLGERDFQCPFCTKMFASASTFKVHKKSHTEEKQFQCSVCPKSFFHQSDFNRHNRIHTGDKPYQCLVCTKRFSRLNTLKTHKRIHTGEKPYQCLQCSKRFATASHLSWHNKTHTGEKPHQCLVCSKKFSQLHDLTMHDRIHTGDKPYQCLVCSKSFIQLGTLTSHKRIHTGEKPYKCKQCSKRFITSSRLNRHNKSRHQKK